MTPAMRAAVEAEARSWLGTPYHNHARLKGVGVDCAQILCAVYEATGSIGHTNPGWYAPDWHMHRGEEVYQEWIDRYCLRLPGSVKPLPGDIALFRFGRTYSHSAIVVSDDELVHAYIGRGVVLSRLDEEPLAGRPHIFWTLR